MKTVVIILGAARSGSTLLAKAIGNHRQVFALGEINRFNIELSNKDTHCGCGNKLCDCEFWQTVVHKLSNDNNIDIIQNPNQFPVGIFKQATIPSKLMLLFPTIVANMDYKNKIIDSEISNTIELYKHMFNKTKSEVLVDSTKGLFRALILASKKDTGIQFKFIHYNLLFS